VAAHNEDFVILACTVFIQSTSVTDGRTDRQTPRRWQKRAKHSAFARKNYCNFLCLLSTFFNRRCDCNLRFSCKLTERFVMPHWHGDIISSSLSSLAATAAAVAVAASWVLKS